MRRFRLERFQAREQEAAAAEAAERREAERANKATERSKRGVPRFRVQDAARVEAEREAAEAQKGQPNPVVYLDIEALPAA